MAYGLKASSCDPLNKKLLADMLFLVNLSQGVFIKMHSTCSSNVWNTVYMQDTKCQHEYPGVMNVY